MLDDASFPHPGVVDAADADRPARRLDAEERTQVGARTIEPERDEIALFDDRHDIDVRVRKPTVHVLHHDADESVWSVNIAERAVRHEVVVHDRADACFIVCVDRRINARTTSLTDIVASAVSGRESTVPGMAADVIDALRTSRDWINYAPGPPFDFLAGRHPATEAQLTTELTRLYDAGFRGLVTNHRRLRTRERAENRQGLWFRTRRRQDVVAGR